MEALFLKLIEQLNGAVLVLVVILIFVLWLSYKAGGMIKSFKDYEENKEKIDTKIDGVKDVLSQIKATTELLYQAYLAQAGSRTTENQSPLNLSDLGERVAESIKVKEKVNGHWNLIKAKVDKKSPTNPYDIQSVALEIARNCFEQIFNEQEREEIKTVAYNEGLTMLDIYPIIGIAIRDKIFSKENISAEEVDKHDPAKKR